MADLTCVHCGDRIVRQDFLGREAYTHQPAGASFQDGQHHYCHITAATPPFTKEQEIESLAAEIHEAYAYQYDECDHGTYVGGAMHGEPYSMCLINAERIIRRRSNPPVASPEIPGFEGTRSALDGLTIRKEKTSD